MLVKKSKKGKVNLKKEFSKLLKEQGKMDKPQELKIPAKKERELLKGKVRSFNTL